MSCTRATSPTTRTSTSWCGRAELGVDPYRGRATGTHGGTAGAVDRRARALVRHVRRRRARLVAGAADPDRDPAGAPPGARDGERGATRRSEEQREAGARRENGARAQAAGER